jgi:hypothetical protein
MGMQHLGVSRGRWLTDRPSGLVLAHGVERHAAVPRLPTKLANTGIYTVVHDPPEPGHGSVTTIRVIAVQRVSSKQLSH